MTDAQSGRTIYMPVVDDFNKVDTQGQWVDVKNDRLHTEKKTRFGRIWASLVSFFTRGRCGTKYDGLIRVANAIQQEIGRNIREGESQTLDSAVTSMAKLRSLASKSQKARLTIEKALSNITKQLFNAPLSTNSMQQLVDASLLSAPSLFRQTEDLQKVVQKYNALLEQPETAQKFLKGADESGKTFFHYLVEMEGGSLQEQTLRFIEHSLGVTLMKECFFLEDDAKKTPLDSAIERGQMSVVAHFLPIPPTKESTLGEQDIAHLKGSMHNLLHCLSDQTQREQLFVRCPGANAYDKLNHIISAIHALACSYPEVFETAFRSLEENERSQLPVEIQAYAKLSRAQREEILNQLYGAYEQCQTVDDIRRLEDTWHLIEPEKSDQHHRLDATSLDALVILATTEGSEDSENTHLNQLAEILNPFAAYDQRVDFCDLRQVTFNNRPVIHQLLAQSNSITSPSDLKAVKKLLSMFIHKYPDLLFAKNEQGQDPFHFLESRIRAVTLKEDLSQHLRTIRDDLPQILFENRTKKALKFRLEALGRSLMQRP